MSNHVGEVCRVASLFCTYALYERASEDGRLTVFVVGQSMVFILALLIGCTGGIRWNRRGGVLYAMAKVGVLISSLILVALLDLQHGPVFTFGAISIILIGVSDLIFRAQDRRRERCSPGK